MHNLSSYGRTRRHSLTIRSEGTSRWTGLFEYNGCRISALICDNSIEGRYVRDAHGYLTVNDCMDAASLELICAADIKSTASAGSLTESSTSKNVSDLLRSEKAERDAYSRRHHKTILRTSPWITSYTASSASASYVRSNKITTIGNNQNSRPL